MPGVLANHPHHTIAADNLAIAADFFDRGAHFHLIVLQIPLSKRRLSGDAQSVCASSTQKTLALETAFLQQALVLMRHQVRLNLGHEIHHYHNNDQQ